MSFYIDVLKYIYSLCSNKYPAKIILIRHFGNFLLLQIFQIKLIQFFFFWIQYIFKRPLFIHSFLIFIFKKTILKEASILDYNGLNSKHAQHDVTCCSISLIIQKQFNHCQNVPSNNSLHKNELNRLYPGSHKCSSSTVCKGGRISIILILCGDNKVATRSRECSTIVNYL